MLLKTKQNLTFYCETCVVGKCPQFVTDQAKIKSAIESQRLARSGIPEDFDKQPTPPGTTNSNIKDVHDNHPPRTGTDGLSGKDSGDVDGQESEKSKTIIVNSTSRADANLGDVVKAVVKFTHHFVDLLYLKETMAVTRVKLSLYSP